MAASMSLSGVLGALVASALSVGQDLRRRYCVRCAQLALVCLHLSLNARAGFSP